jgi:hypothetical protein
MEQRDIDLKCWRPPAIQLKPFQWEQLFFRKEDSELVAINERGFIFLVHETPYFALDVMRTLADRLRHMNELV